MAQKAIIKLLVTNLALLAAFAASEYFEWNSISQIKGVVAVQWTPLRVTIWTSTVSSPIIGDGILWTNNWSFIILLIIIGVNLLAVWKIEKMKPQPAEQSQLSGHQPYSA